MQAINALERFLSTPSARRATAQDVQSYDRSTISIHALREEGDRLLQGVVLVERISIHALREEGDGSGQFVLDCVYLFLSTPSARRAT